VPDFLGLVTFNPAAYETAGATLQSAATQVSQANTTFTAATGADMPTWTGRARDGQNSRATRTADSATAVVTSLEQAGQAMAGGGAQLTTVVGELRELVLQAETQGFIVLPAGVVVISPEQAATVEGAPAFEAVAAEYTALLEGIVGQATAVDNRIAEQVRAAGGPLDYGFGPAGDAGGIRPVTIRIWFEERMSRVQFRRKANQLQALGEQGMLRKMTKVSTGDTATDIRRDTSTTSSYRGYVQGQIGRRYAHNPDFVAAARGRIDRSDADHIPELQLGSPDTWAVLRFLHRYTNRRIGMQQIWPQISHLPNGTPIRIVVTSYE
jgi:hypothetical protein